CRLTAEDRRSGMISCLGMIPTATSRLTTRNGRSRGPWKSCCRSCSHEQPSALSFSSAKTCTGLMPQHVSWWICSSKVFQAPGYWLSSFRPEFDPPPWIRRAYVTQINLDRLGRAPSMEIARVAAGGRLPTPVLDQLLPRTDGNPLFIEELSRTVAESG